ncbi:hypothetical protein LTR05_006828 [Lithohypha guttulata]|uniref:Uncharacterized protein n=1 Tax=Lithohypha guttulata TaxID=1690604 RepID=A0AAN7SX22_9EURO|nr:hypothetical protein LTR05_006828 [Lithohypha guttulata]
MVVGGTYEIAWTGATGLVDLYVKKDPSQSSWRSYIYGSGNATSVNFTVSDLYVSAGMDPGRTYVFTLWDDLGNCTSSPIYLRAALTKFRGRRQTT